MKPPTLKNQQAEFKQYLFTGENEAQLAHRVADSRNIAPLLRLEVYRNAYYSRLQGALAHDFPALLAVVGEAAFGRLMAGYLREHPSTSPLLRDVGRSLPAWLRLHEPVLADLASLEWAVLKAFDAADAPLLSAKALEGIPLEHWQWLHFTLHPSVTLLPVEGNAREVWKALRQGWPLPSLQAGAPESLVIWRSARGPAVQAIDPSHYVLLDSLAKGQNFGEGCARLAELEAHRNVPVLAAQGLALALARGWISDLALEGGR